MKAKEPLTSVIIPCYNMEAFLPAALNSLLAQTAGNLQILVIDDGSSDGSANVAKEFAARDPRIQLFQKVNGGLSSARNYGLDRATGEFVAFLDGDDFWHPEKVERHLLHFAHHSKIGISYSATQFVGMDGRSLRHSRKPKMARLSPYYLYCRNPITNGSNAVFRREIFDHHRFDETLPNNQDVDCWLRIAFAPPACWEFGGIPERLTYYRVNSGGLSHDFSKHYECARRVWEKSKSYAPEIATQFAGLAEAFQLRFYARRAISARDFQAARSYLRLALEKDARILLREPVQTLVTLLVSLLPFTPGPKLAAIEEDPVRRPGIPPH
jgi:glycosyltransferase involved in cell wall biosynthesis